MRIVDARWTPQINMLVIFCDGCKKEFEHRSDRWNVRCACGNCDYLGKLRDQPGPLQRPKLPTKERILIIDGLNNFIRHYCVNPTLDVNGQPIGGIVGFLRMMKNILREVKPTKVVVAWDGKGGSAKRRGVYSAYKMGRKPRLNREYGDDESVDDARKNMQWQHRKLREYLDMLGCSNIEIENCEADDIIGFLCSGFYSDVDKVVVSTDQDMLQLVGKHTLVYSPTRQMYFTNKNFIEHEKVLPENYIYLKALNGDGSDNLKGIKGLGPKTIIKFFPILVERKTDLDELKKLSETLEPKGKREKEILKALLEQWDLIKSNLQLMQLTVPIISAQSVRVIKYAVRPEAFTFQFSDVKLQIIRDGIQLPDADLFQAFTEYRHRFQKEDIENVTE